MKKRLLSIFLACCMVFSLIPTTVLAANSDIPFEDVKTTDWFYDGACYAYENGLMQGTSSTTFAPNGITSRGMIVTILYRLEGEPTLMSGNIFTDVSSGDWYEKAVVWANGKGIVTGYGNGKFGPNDPITREQLAAIMYRYADYKAYDTSARADLSKFSDSGKVSSYASDALSWANAAGLLTGIDTVTLAPQGNATRAQAAAILSRFCEEVIEQKAEETPKPISGGTGGSTGGGGGGSTPTDTYYTVTFDSNGGSAVASQQVKKGECAVEPSEPTKDGYTFCGWYSDSALNNAYVFSTLITNNISLYAKWNDNATTYDLLIEARQEELDSIEELNGGELPEITLDEDDFIPNAILGKFSKKIVTNADSAKEALKDIEALMSFSDVDEEFSDSGKRTVGETNFFRLQQEYKGTPVYGKQIIISTDKDGNILSLTGDYDPLSVTINETQEVTMEQAYSIAAVEFAGLESEGTLIIYALEDNYDEYAWMFGGLYTVIVSAVDGLILSSWENSFTSSTAALGSGVNEAGYLVTFNTVLNDFNTDNTGDDIYEFRDSVRNINYSDESGNIFTDSDNIWQDTISPGYEADTVISLQESLSQTYDYYLNVLGLKSYDGNGASIKAKVIPGWTNASSSRSGEVLEFGTGAAHFYSLKCTTHEFTHSIQSSINDVTYSGESGALMEAYADIGGELAQCYYNGSSDWIHGSRNIADPLSSRNPVMYKGTYWSTEVHQSSTVISHAAYLMYDAGFTDINVLTELFFRAWHYISTSAKFSDYRAAVLAAASNMNLSTERKAIIADAFDKVNVKTTSANYTESSSVTITFDVNTSSGGAVAGARIDISDSTGCTVAWSYTDANGLCSFDLRTGKYYYTISAPGYDEYSDSFIAIFLFDRTINVKLKNSGEQETTVCILGGKITDAVTGNTVPGATIEFRKGANNFSGRIEKSITTDSNGKYKVQGLSYGYYTITIKKSGYITSTALVQASVVNWEDAERDDYLAQNFSISPLLISDEQYRVVLTWGEIPRDLDSHFNAITISNNRDHVCYMRLDGSTANLDIDDTTSFGPETVTVTGFNQLKNGFVYTVHDYTNRESSNSTELSTSGATIQVYWGSTLLKTYFVPTNKSGTVWNVFSIDSAGNITDINTFEYIESPEDVGASLLPSSQLDSSAALMTVNSVAYEKE